MEICWILNVHDQLDSFVFKCLSLMCNTCSIQVLKKVPNFEQKIKVTKNVFFMDRKKKLKILKNNEY